MEGDNYKKQFEYGNRLGRITGEGRFNNVNSIIVNFDKNLIPRSYLFPANFPLFGF